MPTTRPSRASHPSTRLRDLAQAAVRENGLSYARAAGITLTDTPSGLYRLLVLTVLLANRVPAASAVDAAKALSRAGLRTPGSMAAATWQERGDLLMASGYRRLAGRASTVLGDGASLVAQTWGGDLRRVRVEAAGSVSAVRRSLETVPGIGHVGSAIFCREVQGLWPDLAPFADERVLAGARHLGLPATPHDLAGLVAPEDLVGLVAACVRASFVAPAADVRAPVVRAPAVREPAGTRDRGRQ